MNKCCQMYNSQIFQATWWETCKLKVSGKKVGCHCCHTTMVNRVFIYLLENTTYYFCVVTFKFNTVILFNLKPLYDYYSHRQIVPLSNTFTSSFFLSRVVIQSG